MLKLLGLGIVALLIGQLPDEAVAEPDEQETCVADVPEVAAILKHVSAAMVTMHQGP